MREGIAPVGVAKELNFSHDSNPKFPNRQQVFHGLFAFKEGVSGLLRSPSLVL